MLFLIPASVQIVLTIIALPENTTADSETAQARHRHVSAEIDDSAFASAGEPFIISGHGFKYFFSLKIVYKIQKHKNSKMTQMQIRIWMILFLPWIQPPSGCEPPSPNNGLILATTDFSSQADWGCTLIFPCKILFLQLKPS